MTLSKKVLALSSGVLAALSLGAFGQGPTTTRVAARPAAGSADSIVVGGTIDWYEKSDVSALREGVIEKIEYQQGSRVEAGKPIGFMHKRMADLTAKKAEIAAKNHGPIESALAKAALAKSEIARLRRLEKMGKGFVSESELQKAEAELQVALAQRTEAEENQNVAKAESEIAKEVVEEHTILAPFTGIITDRIKNQGRPSAPTSRSSASAGRTSSSSSATCLWRAPRGSRSATTSRSRRPSTASHCRSRTASSTARSSRSRARSRPSGRARSSSSPR